MFEPMESDYTESGALDFRCLSTEELGDALERGGYPEAIRMARLARGLMSNESADEPEWPAREN